MLVLERDPRGTSPRPVAAVEMCFVESIPPVLLQTGQPRAPSADTFDTDHFCASRIVARASCARTRPVKALFKGMLIRQGELPDDNCADQAARKKREGLACSNANPATQLLATIIGTIPIKLSFQQQSGCYIRRFPRRKKKNRQDLQDWQKYTLSSRQSCKSCPFFGSRILML
jgi:hypothetical protein